VPDSTLIASWHDLGREAQCKPSPLYPDGVDVDAAAGARKTCRIALPYPAERCGLWLLKCSRCGLTAAVSAAGRRDDPRSVRVGCKR
jgi:hypothetical protein